MKRMFTASILGALFVSACAAGSGGPQSPMPEPVALTGPSALPTADPAVVALQSQVAELNQAVLDLQSDNAALRSQLAATSSPTPTPIATPTPKPTPRPTPKPTPKPMLKVVSVKKTGQGRVTAWCPSGYSVLSGRVTLNDNQGGLFYPDEYYYRDDGPVKSGSREGWRGTQLLDNDPDIAVNITVSARCAGY
jgi:hypothetical protein